VFTAAPTVTSPRRDVIPRHVMMTASLLIGLVLLMTPVLRSAAAAADAGDFSDAVSSLSSTSLPHALRRAINGINTAHLHYYIPVSVKKVART